jgi:hypothetical protein
MGIVSILTLALQLAPNVVLGVETLFKKKPANATPAQAAANSAAKTQAALNMAVAGITVALGIDPSAFGDNEKALITAIHDDVVKYFNAKGWPVQ